MSGDSTSDVRTAVIRMVDVSAGAMSDLSIAVVEEIDWTVHRGDFWALAGLQGAGKSDLLLMTAGLTGPLKGQYRLFGNDMPIFDESRLPERLRLGLVFDGGQLFNHLTVSENVRLPLRYHRNLSAIKAEEMVGRFLDAMELGPFADSTPGSLNRNWKKRVGLARALILKPELLLVDNPLGGLDFRHSLWWLSWLDRLAKGDPLLDNRPVTMVVTTADLRPWRGHARQFAVLRDRRLVVLGEWSQVEAANAELVRELLLIEQSRD